MKGMKGMKGGSSSSSGGSRRQRNYGVFQVGNSLEYSTSQDSESSSSNRRPNTRLSLFNR
jgi:hypothetical protein